MNGTFISWDSWTSISDQSNSSNTLFRTYRLKSCLDNYDSNSIQKSIRPYSNRVEFYFTMSYPLLCVSGNETYSRYSNDSRKVFQLTDRFSGITSSLKTRSNSSSRSSASESYTSNYSFTNLFQSEQSPAVQFSDYVNSIEYIPLEAQFLNDTRMSTQKYFLNGGDGNVSGPLGQFISIYTGTSISRNSVVTFSRNSYILPDNVVSVKGYSVYSTKNSGGKTTRHSKTTSFYGGAYIKMSNPAEIVHVMTDGKVLSATLSEI